MSYLFETMSDEQLETFPLMDDGVYDFEVLKSTRKTSKSGNPMAEVQLHVWDKAGKTNLVFDYLVFSKVPLNIKKVKHFCDATGLQEAYKKGELPEELAKLCGKVSIGTQEGQPNPNGGMYAKRNVVVDYVMTDKGAVKHEAAVDVDPFTDDVPF